MCYTVVRKNVTPDEDEEKTMSYTTSADDARTIRAEYKANGWNRNHVSVRASNYSMGSSISIEIKSPTVDIEKAAGIAKRIAEKISRCEITGEILSGGNRFVSVRLSDDLCDVLAERYEDAVTAAIATVEKGIGFLATIEGTDAIVGWDQHGYDIKLWIGDDFAGEHNSARSVAIRIGTNNARGLIG